MINRTLFSKRSGLTAGSLFSLTILMVSPCHAESEQEGDIRLDQLEQLKLDTRLDRLNKIQEQIHFGQMPPKKRKSAADRYLKAIKGYTNYSFAQKNPPTAPAKKIPDLCI